MKSIKITIQENIGKAFFICLLILMLLPVVVNAGGTNPEASSSGSQALSNSDSEALSNSGADSFAGVNIDSHDSSSGYSYNPAVDLSKSVPNAIAPNPHVGFGVCDSAYTFSLGYIGGGIGFGVPVSDTDCNRREDAKTMKGLNAVEVGFEVMCEDLRVFRASYRAGKPCYPSEDLVDELSDDELELLSFYKQQEEDRLREEADRRKNLENLRNISGKRDIYKEMQLMEDRVAQKLDNIHRLNNLK